MPIYEHDTINEDIKFFATPVSHTLTIFPYLELGCHGYLCF